MVSELRFTLDRETHDLILESLQDIQAQLKEMTATFNGTAVSHEPELLELQNPETNLVDAFPEPQTDPQEHQEQRIEVIGNNGPKDLEKSDDPVVGLKSRNHVFGGSVSYPTKQGKVKDDPDVQNIPDKMFGLSSHPKILEEINAKRSILREKISVKRYHKVRKKARNHSAVPEYKVSDRLLGRNLSSRITPMKKRFDLGEKATQHKLELAYKNYGMCFGYPSSKNSRKSCRCLNDIGVKRGSSILDYGLQSQDTVILKFQRNVELVWIRNSDPLLKELKLKRGLNTHTQMVIDDSWFLAANLRLGWKHSEEFSLHRDGYVRYFWDTGQENDSMGLGHIQRFKEKSLEKSQGITISVQEDLATVECGGQVVGKNSGKHWIEAIATWAELGSSENLTREIKDSVLVPKSVLPISCRHEIEENCDDDLSWSVRVWEPGGSVIVRILKWPEKYHHQDEGIDLNMGKEMKKESPSLDKAEECSNDIKEQWLKMVLSVLSSCDDNSTLRTRCILQEEYQASIMAMTKVLEWFFDKEGIGSDSVVRKGQYEEERDTVTKLVFYKTETLIDKEQSIGTILSLGTDSMTAILDIKSGTIGKMVKYGDEWSKKDRLKWVKVQAGYKQLCDLRVHLAQFDGKDRKYKQVSVSDNGVKRATSSPTETSRKAGFQGYNGVYGFTLNDTRVKNVEEEVSDHGNGVSQSWCHRNSLDILCRETPYAVLLLNNIQTHHDIMESEFHANTANIITLVRVAILYSVSLKRVIFIHGEYHSPRPPETSSELVPSFNKDQVNTALKFTAQSSSSSTLRTRLFQPGSIDKHLDWAS